MASIGEITIEQRLGELEQKWTRAKWLNIVVLTVLVLATAASTATTISALI